MGEESKLHLYCCLMEISSLSYLSFFAIISVLALIPLRVLLSKVEEFRDHSTELQKFLHTFLCFSLSHAFLFNPSLRLRGRDSGRLPPVWCYLYLNLMLYFSLEYDTSSSLFLIFVKYKLFQMSLLMTFPGLLFFLSTSLGEVRGTPETVSMDFFHWLAWIIFTASTSIVYQDVDHTLKIEFDNPLLPYVVGPTIAYLLFLQKTAMEFPVSIKLLFSLPWGTIFSIPISLTTIVGIIGNIVANHYMKDKSLLLFSLVVLFSIFLMANIAMRHSTCHTAIFSFLVGAILDIAGERFGLNIYMWVVGLGVAVFFVLFGHLDEFNRRYRGGHRRKKKGEDTSMVLPKHRKSITSLEREGLVYRRSFR